MKKTVLAVLAALAVTGCVMGEQELTGVYEASPLQRDLTAARRATAPYHDLSVATAAGYANTGLPCINGQGFHYIKGSLIGTNDVTLPQLLVYFPNSSGDLDLVALEWIQPIADETTKPLTLFGQTFHGPNQVEGVPFPFFALHLWAWRTNPDGLFEDAHPGLRCP